jgi:Na+/H+ antiporter NhaD/arsenite permease-like protein
MGGVLRIFPLPYTLIALPLLALAEPGALWRVDYALLLTFLGFFLFVDNLEALLPLRLSDQQGVFLPAVALSQVLSNVPTAVFIAPFTHHWRALLWGVNAGGFGTPIASLANLIGFRLFLGKAGSGERRRFLLGYSIGEALALLLAIALFFTCSP